MDKPKKSKKCSCIGDNHTCGKVQTEDEGVEHLAPVLVGVVITPSRDESDPMEQLQAPMELIESGADATNPFACTPTLPGSGESKGGKDRLLVPAVSVQGSDGTSPDSEQLSVPNTSLEGSSDTSPDADATSSSCELASNIQTPISTKASEDPSQPIPKDESETKDKKSTSPQRPTDMNVAQRRSVHEFSGSEEDGILKRMQYVMPDQHDPPQRRMPADNPTSETKSESTSAAEGSSSSDSKSRPSTGSCATSFDTLTGSSSVSEGVDPDDVIRRMRSKGPKVTVTLNLDGTTTTKSGVEDTSTNPSTGGEHSSGVERRVSTNVEDRGSNPNQNRPVLLQVDSSDDEESTDMDVPENEDDDVDDRIRKTQ